MKLLVAGTRTAGYIKVNNEWVRDDEKMRRILDEISKYADSKNITEIISGGARGADNLGIDWGRRHNRTVTICKPEWNKYGKGAGFIRNASMVDSCDFAILFWDGSSRGTKNTIDHLEKAGKPYRIVRIDDEATVSND